ncbi:hypothetical protein GPALN_006565 [Globodera pallida]|nr:hypothetical protein GPALN_006565 [Globodera pallida]
MMNAFRAEEMDEFYAIAQKLHLIFGEVVVDGLNIAETGIVRIVRDENALYPRIFEVRACSFNSHPTYIYESINFCKCPFFTTRVLHEDAAYVCQHLLAMRFSRACNLLKPDRVESAEVMQAVLTAVSKPIEVDPGLKREEEEEMISASQDDLEQGI